MTVAPEVLVAIAVVFAVVTGANDGGALIAPGLRVPGLSVPVSLGMLIVAVVAFPLLVSTAVAGTMLESIVGAERDGTTALAIGFIAGVVVSAALAWIGLPTTLTLAVIGGIAGAGLGMALDVGWSAVVRVLLIGMAAPAVGAVLALVGSWAWRSFRNASYLWTVRWTHATAYAAQCVAYGANDGQKMLVLFLAASITADGDTGAASLDWWAYPALAAAFAVGAVIGLPRVARSVGNGILSSRPTHAVTAEFSAAAAVLGSAAAGAPVSMTQSVAGGLVGAAVHESARRVRWRMVRNLAVAWVVTLPASFGAAALAGVIAGR
ncbi:inorganic phosphate transporter [Phytoactinopolyspora halotolerans]|uniref:Inorganic phosphate transporter n=1 Tax=Phytoactinopolyspora halotolerans TaxID=1981512 RepID=A0A6L9S7P7_9ACTN|nr:inorganic phosphate transporter [Phytoactinopolyspora halotolerans]